MAPALQNAVTDYELTCSRCLYMQHAQIYYNCGSDFLDLCCKLQFPPPELAGRSEAVLSPSVPCLRDAHTWSPAETWTVRMFCLLALAKILWVFKHIPCTASFAVSVAVHSVLWPYVCISFTVNHWNKCPLFSCLFLIPQETQNFVRNEKPNKLSLTFPRGKLQKVETLIITGPKHRPKAL